MPLFKKKDKNDQTKNLLKQNAAATGFRPAYTEELAEVARYNADTNSYVVITRGVGGCKEQPGGRELVDIPRKVDNPNNASPLSPGALVVINWALGFPYIDGVLPIENNLDTVQNQPTVGTAAKTVRTPSNAIDPRAGDYRTPHIPKDLLPQDWVQTSPEGNRVGVYRNGYCILDGGPATKARVETFGSKDLVRITCEDLELITGFGTIEFYNTEGRCGMQLRGGADQLSESGGEEEQWTFKLDIGDTGDFFTLEVCTVDGQTKAKFNITADGKIEVIATKGLSWVNGGTDPLYIENAADMITKVLGQLRTTVRGSTFADHNGNHEIKVGEKDSLSVGADSVRMINGNHVVSVGDNQTMLVSGGTAINAKPSNYAVKVDVLNGSYYLELGNSLKGANPKAQAGYTVVVNNGEVTLGANPDFLAPPPIHAAVNLNTQSVRSVALGGMVSSAPFSAVLYEPLLTVLQSMVSIFDAHAHVPLMQPVTPMSATITPLLNAVKSQRVLIGQ